jgi:hypothetical protein
MRPEQPWVREWKTRDGRVIAINEMEDSHLLAAMGMLERGAFAKQSQLAMALYNYAAQAPDGAAMCAEMEAEYIGRLSPQEFLQLRNEHYKAMSQEARRRQLTK